MHSLGASRFIVSILALTLAGCSTLPRVPANGLYAGELCTAVADGPLNCGAADVFLSNDRAKVRVSDIIYDLTLDDGQVDVILVHTRTLVDTWSGSYSWAIPYLRFIDTERRTFYRVRFADPVQGQDTQR
jgi:hypothetical protein